MSAFVTENPMMTVSTMPVSTQQTLKNLFSSLTPEQKQIFLQDINSSDPSSRNAECHIVQREQTVSTAADHIISCSRNVARKGKLTRRHSRNIKYARQNGKLRPLNSFIAFRSFYSSMFPNLSQKVKSGLLREIWNLDPFKAKWSILAKAYSKVRDNHSDQVSLDSFLSLNGPLIGIVPPNEYVDSMGIRVQKKTEKEYEVSKYSDMESPSQSELTTNLSVDDIVTYCYQSGYVSGKVPQNDDETLGVGVAMAVTAQTTKQPRVNLRRESENEKDRAGGSSISRDITSDTVNSQVQGDTAIVPPFFLLSMPDHFKSTLVIEENDRTFHALRYDAPYTIEQHDAHMRTTIENFQSEGEPGVYDALFQPTMQTPPVQFDPREVQSPFDAFEIGGFIPY